MADWAKTTPVEKLSNGVFIKRDDLACDIGPANASGAKVRQYLQMVDACPGMPLVVGCSAYSCQQVYIADAMLRSGRPGVIFVPARAKPSAATSWAKAMGAAVYEVRPGYLSVIRARAKEYAKAHGAVRWSPAIAAGDAKEQAMHFKTDCEVLVVPVGSGAILGGILAGLALAGWPGKVLGIAVSGMASAAKVKAAAAEMAGDRPLPPLRLVRHPDKYERGAFKQRLGEARLDPWYAAKCLPWVRPGYCLWNTGRRPVGIMHD